MAGGSRENQGRLEVNYAGVWGVVCDDFFDLEDANVACRQLGFGGAEDFHYFSEFGSGNGIFWLDDLGCDGDEDSLQDCPNNGWGSHNCYAYSFFGEAVGLTCASMYVCCVYTVNVCMYEHTHEHICTHT